jgi:uncharacterized protein with NRDE domain
MCTVSYIPSNKGFILTSNRDEKIQRITIPPKTYRFNDSSLIYPKDLEKGGTWICIGNQNKVACLLNGAFENHLKKENYTYSRGAIPILVAKQGLGKNHIPKDQLFNTEPFTLIIIEQEKEIILTEYRWDGLELHKTNKDSSYCHIWSSATLYNAMVREERENWFKTWQNQTPHKTTSNILEFHLTKKGNEDSNDIQINRPNGLKTVSVTQITGSREGFHMHYIDLVKNLNN